MEVAMMWWWSDYGIGPWTFAPIFMLLALIFCGTMMFMMMRGMMGGHKGRSDDLSALQILKDRFARGEINQTEYEQRRRVLTG
jgi:putative membrane protein